MGSISHSPHYNYVHKLKDRASPGNPGCPGTHYVDQAGFELTEIQLPPSLASAGS